MLCLCDKMLGEEIWRIFQSGIRLDPDNANIYDTQRCAAMETNSHRPATSGGSDASGGALPRACCGDFPRQ